MRPRLADLVGMFPPLNTTQDSHGTAAALSRIAGRPSTCITVGPSQSHMALRSKRERLVLPMEDKMRTQPAKWKAIQEASISSSMGTV